MLGSPLTLGGPIGSPVGTPSYTAPAGAGRLSGWLDIVHDLVDVGIDIYEGVTGTGDDEDDGTARPDRDGTQSDPTGDPTRPDPTGDPTRGVPVRSGGLGNLFGGGASSLLLLGGIAYFIFK